MEKSLLIANGAWSGHPGMKSRTGNISGSMTSGFGLDLEIQEESKELLMKLCDWHRTRNMAIFNGSITTQKYGYSPVNSLRGDV